MLVRVYYKEKQMRLAGIPAPKYYDRLYRFVMWSIGYLLEGRDEFGKDSDYYRFRAFEFDSCFLPESNQEFEKFFLGKVTLR